jgi:hypothetical protein
MNVAAYDVAGRLLATYHVVEDGDDLDTLLDADGLRFVESLDSEDDARRRGWDHVILVEEINDDKEKRS